MKTHSIFIPALCAALLLFSQAPIWAAEKKEPEQTKSPGAKLSATDQKFVQEAAQGGLTEVKLGELAKSKGAREDVKAFGAQMVSDHGQANEELKSLASAKGITLQEGLDSKHQAMIDKLSKLEGAQFDKAYIDGMVMDHQKDAAEFDEEAKNAKDSDVKAFAEKTAAVIHSHLDKIKGLQKAAP